MRPPPFPSASRAIIVVLLAASTTVTIFLTSSLQMGDADDDGRSFRAPHLQRQLLLQNDDGGRDNPAEAGERRYLTLEELTRNPPEGSINCEPPLLPAYDRIIPEDERIGMPGRRIPRSIHVSMRSRCLSPDLHENMMKWKEALPYHSYYFHDDEAVDRLFDMPWEEFPHLRSLMRCVRLKGAMKIDIWRILVIYRYGGLYTDVDNYPGDKFTELGPITATDSAFFLSDAWSRPSQWFFAMEPEHPIAYLAIFVILQRLQRMEGIERPKVVFVTGPDALKHAYGDALERVPGVDIFAEGVHPCTKALNEDGRNWTATKLTKPSKDYVVLMDMKETVTFRGRNVTRGTKNEMQHGVKHWFEARNHNPVEFGGSCMEYLYSLDVAST